MKPTFKDWIFPTSTLIPPSGTDDDSSSDSGRSSNLTSHEEDNDTWEVMDEESWLDWNIRQIKDGDYEKARTYIDARVQYEPLPGIPDKNGGFDFEDVMPCYYCVCSGVPCRMTQARRNYEPHCDRYVEGNLVGITKDTVFVEVETSAH